MVEVRYSAPVKTGPDVHTDSYTVGARIFPGGKAAGDVALTTHHI